WFRRDEDGRFLWPGFGENSRVLKWVFERCDESVDAVDSPIGKLPAPGSLDLDGLDVATADLDAILSVDEVGWKSAVPQIRDHFARFGDKLPKELMVQVDELEAALA
ncbi:MAG: phosphoenolpyruvate carboxykinase domain-containing protein, partial [Actinomycetota bacterium]